MDRVPSIPASLIRAKYSLPTLADKPTMTWRFSRRPIFTSISRIASVATAPSMTGIIMSMRMQS